MVRYKQLCMQPKIVTRVACIIVAEIARNHLAAGVVPLLRALAKSLVTQGEIEVPPSPEGHHHQPLFPESSQELHHSRKVMSSATSKLSHQTAGPTVCLPRHDHTILT